MDFTNMYFMDCVCLVCALFLSTHVRGWRQRSAGRVPRVLGRNVTTAWQKSYAAMMAHKPRILGGSWTTVWQHPWAVSLNRRYKQAETTEHWCGGSIISTRHALTAAHCICVYHVKDRCELFDSDEFRVMTGGTVTINMTWDNLDAWATAYPIEEFFPHPAFAYEDRLNMQYVFDIAVIRLTKVLFLRRNVAQPIPLPDSKANVMTLERQMQAFEHSRIQCTSCGWGHDVQDRAPANITQSTLAVIPLEECKREYWDAYKVKLAESEQFCTVSTSTFEAMCPGDSGGALVCNGDQWGVFAFSGDCQYPGTPQVWTRIDLVLPFIRKLMEDRSAPTAASAASANRSLLAGLADLVHRLCRRCWL